MQVNQIEIDNGIIENAANLSGVKDKKELIEKALLFFAQQQKYPAPKIINDFHNLPASTLETLETASIYQGKKLSLEDMKEAIEYEASLHR